MTDSEILEAIHASENNPVKSRNAWMLLGVSLLAFAGLGFVQWDLKFLILSIIALFIHELGHLLAMKLFRYKNLKMLFLPFIGAAASGHSKEQNASKIALISLFGPLVGMLSCFGALALWSWTKIDFFLSYANLALFLNVFNLLPMVPLDGGHFLNETLLSRFPKAELFFRIFAILGLGFLAYALQSWIFGLLGLFILVTLVVTYKVSMATAILRKRDGMKGDELTLEKVGQIREEIRKANPHFESEKNIKGLPNVIGSTWTRINKTFPSLAATFGLLVAYVVVSVLLPSVILFSCYIVAGKRFVSLT